MWGGSLSRCHYGELGTDVPEVNTFTSGFSRFIHRQQRIADILSTRKEAVPEGKGRHPARDVKMVMDEKVRRSKLGVETTSLDAQDSSCAKKEVRSRP